MSADFDREHETVAAAFQSLRAESSAHFPPPPVDELIMRGPAVLRRRRIVAFAAVLGACTAVTAGGFAVAQTLGPLSGGTDAAETGASALNTAGDDASTLSEPGAPTTDEDGDGTATTAAPAPPADDIEALAIAGPFKGDWADECEIGVQDADFESWTITADTGWSIAFAVEADADGDGESDTLLGLTCGGETGVAAFSTGESEDGEPVLASFGWVWQPDGDHEATGAAAGDAGTVSVEGADTASGAAWSARYEWDGDEFAPVEDDATSEPTEPESTGSSSPEETPTTDAATGGTASSSGS